jgi:hypothetical protein
MLSWILVRSIETAGWLIFLAYSQPPFTYGVALLWLSAVLGRNLLK